MYYIGMAFILLGGSIVVRGFVDSYREKAKASYKQQ